MASTTTNIGLTKPAGTDQALISAINGNMDIIDTKMGAVGNTSVQSQITSLSDQKANYLFIDATSYTHNSKTGWDFAYGEIPDGYNGILKINFNGGYNAICTAYRQSSNWGSIIGHENSNQIPLFYNVQAGTSTLDELALNSKIDTITMVSTPFTKDSNASITVNSSNAGQNGRLVLLSLEYTPSANLNNWTLLGTLLKTPYYQAMGVSDQGNTILLTTTGEVRVLTSTQASGTKQVYYIPYITNQ